MGGKDGNNDEIGPEALVEQFGDYLYSYSIRYFRDAAVAEDLVQETFLAALKGWDSFSGGSSRKTWLVSILRHKIFDHLRKRAQERSAAGAGSAEDVANEKVDDHPSAVVEGDAEMNVMFGHAYGCDDHWLDERAPREWSQSPEVLVEQRQFLSKVDKCLAALPVRLREAFLLREMEECSAAEVAKQLAVSEGNARVLLHRARLLLRDCLELSWFSLAKGS